MVTGWAEYRIPTKSLPGSGSRVDPSPRGRRKGKPDRDCERHRLSAVVAGWTMAPLSGWTTPHAIDCRRIRCYRRQTRADGAIRVWLRDRWDLARPAPRIVHAAGAGPAGGL